jgi:hypothetical protein
VVDRDMTFGINLVGIDAEFSFDIDWHCFLANGITWRG